MEVPINGSGEILKSGLPTEDSLKAEQDLSLPLDVTQIIFSGLDEEDLLNTIKVSSDWKKASLELSKNEYKSIEAFVNWVAPKLGEISTEQKAKLVEVMEGTKVLESVNILEIKSTTKNFSNLIVKIVSELSDDELDNLENLIKKEHKPPIFEKFLKLARLHHDLMGALKITGAARFPIILAISNQFIALGSNEMALNIAIYMGSTEIAKNAIESLIISNKLKQVSGMVYKCFDSDNPLYFRRNLFADMIDIFKKNNNLEQIFEMAIHFHEKKTFDPMLPFLDLNVLDVLKIGIDRSQNEPDFIAKNPGFAKLVAAISRGGMNHDTLSDIPPVVLYDVVVKLLDIDPYDASVVAREIIDPRLADAALNAIHNWRIRDHKNL